MLPHDDPYVRRLLQNELQLTSYQQFSASSSHGAGPTIYEEINSVGIWDFDSEDEEEEQKQQEEEQWEKDWESDSEQQQQMRRQERQRIEQRRE